MIRGIITTILYFHFRHIVGTLDIGYKYFNDQQFKRIVSEKENQLAVQSYHARSKIIELAEIYANILDNEYQYFVDLDPDDVREMLELEEE